MRAFTDQPLVAALLTPDGRLAGAFTGFISGPGGCHRTLLAVLALPLARGGD